MSLNTRVKYQTQQVGNVEVYYREAGDKNAPTLLLLHGFPSSSHMFRDLIPLLADKYHVVAPDFPGFGSTKAPPRGEYDYTFDNLGETITGFVDAIGLDKFAMYVFDYGAPVGFRLALARPDRVTAIITQNGNAYEEGLTDAWQPIRTYWDNDTQENRDGIRVLLTEGTTTFQYTHGVAEDRKHLVGPDGIAHDQAILDRPGSDEIQLDLFRNYKSNVAAYPAWQEFLRTRKLPTLAVWGKNDPFFGPDGAEAYKRDVPDARVELLDAGHFVLETHVQEVASLVHEFLESQS